MQPPILSPVHTVTYFYEPVEILLNPTYRWSFTFPEQKEIGTIDTKPAQNIQDNFLNTARKDRVNITIYLLSGVKLTERIRSFDKYSVILESNNPEQLIFKHAISTVVMGRVPHAAFSSHGEGKPTAVTSGPTPVSPPSASGTEG